MIKRTSGRTAGFTMLELLLVIGIIMILMSMVFTAIHMLRRQSRLVATRSMMNQVRAALEDYLRLYPVLGDTPDEFSSIFTDSPWTYLGRNRIAAGKDPFLDLTAKNLAVGPATGPWSEATTATGDQILDGFTTADRSNHIIFRIINGQSQGSAQYSYTDKIYLRSTTGTPDNDKDDLILRYTNADGVWSWISFSQAEQDTPVPW